MTLSGIKRMEGFLIKPCQKNNQRGISGNNFHNSILSLFILEIISILNPQKKKALLPYHRGSRRALGFIE
jgi:hypothetical protein